MNSAYSEQPFVRVSRKIFFKEPESLDFCISDKEIGSSAMDFGKERILCVETTSKSQPRVDDIAVGTGVGEVPFVDHQPVRRGRAAVLLVTGSSKHTVCLNLAYRNCRQRTSDPIRIHSSKKAV